jgi:2-hydroxy-4-carboxymuconate semialdehyde hemiacetal dehydrogenase
MKVALAGQGAFGIRHLEAMQHIPGIEVISLSGGRPAGTEEAARGGDPALDDRPAETLQQLP